MRRRPKQLTAPPALFHSGGGTPLVRHAAAERGTGEATGPAGGQGVLLTGQPAVLRDVGELFENNIPDREVAAMAQRIARRLALRRRPRARSGGRGAGRLASLPYRYRSDDIDLDRTLEVLTERPVPEDSDVNGDCPPASRRRSVTIQPWDIVVRERMHTRGDVALVVDVSGSMKGEKVRVAAATVAALSEEVAARGDRLALVAFWSDAALLKPLDAHVPAGLLLDQLLRIPARGLTNVGFALAVAHAELGRSPARHRTAVLLSDAVHNAGPDPRAVARRFPRLHVLLETDGEHDAPLAADIARLGRGRLAPVATHRDVAPALNRLLGRAADR